MPHKTRKLVVYGPKDSGKTSWFHVFLGVIPMKFIASITSEKQFAASMITNDSQLILLDEWSEHTLQSDMAKNRSSRRVSDKSGKASDRDMHHKQ